MLYTFTIHTLSNYWVVLRLQHKTVKSCQKFVISILRTCINRLILVILFCMIHILLVIFWWMTKTPFLHLTLLSFSSFNCVLYIYLLCPQNDNVTMNNFPYNLLYITFLHILTIQLGYRGMQKNYFKHTTRIQNAIICCQLKL